MIEITKQPREQYTFSVSYVGDGRLPPGCALESAEILFAVDITDEEEEDISATLLQSNVGEIVDGEARFFLKASAAGEYHLTMVAEFMPGSPKPTLEEDIFVSVHEE